MTRVTASLGDLTKAAVDAVVNAANSSLLGGGGVDGAIHRAGGGAILEECRRIVAARGPLGTGEAVITTAGDLPARWVIHTVGPIWAGDADPEVARRQDAELARCYTSSLDLAVEFGIRTVAFPNISTGVYRFPRPRAAAVSVGAVRTWTSAHPGALDEVHLVCFDRENLDLVVPQIDGGGSP